MNAQIKEELLAQATRQRIENHPDSLCTKVNYMDGSLNFGFLVGPRNPWQHIQES